MRLPFDGGFEPLAGRARTRHQAKRRLIMAMPAPSAGLSWALGISLLAHLFVLLTLHPEPRPEFRAGSRQMQVLLRGKQEKTGPGPSQPAPAEADFGLSSPGLTRSMPARPTAPLKPRTRQKQAHITAQAAVAAVLPESAPPDAAPQASSPGGAQAEKGRLKPEMTASDPAPRVDENALRQYRIALAQAAREFRRYPALARERGWEGVVRVRLQWPRGGGECVVEVLKGSGHSLLDEQAVLMLEQAARRSPLPESLRGQSFELILPVEFSLQQP